MQAPQVMGEVVAQPQVAPMEGMQVVMLQSQRPTHAMTMLDSIKTCLTRKYADFNGRASRSEYWWFILTMSIVYIGILAGGFSLVYVLQDSLSSDQKYASAAILIILVGVIGFATFIPYLGVIVRRFHDQGHTGWMILLGLIPYIGGIIIFVFMLLEGEGHTNRFGPCPTNRLD